MKLSIMSLFMLLQLVLRNRLIDSISYGSFIIMLPQHRVIFGKHDETDSDSLQRESENMQAMTSFLSNYVKVQLSEKRIYIGQRQLSLPKVHYIYHFPIKFILNYIKGFVSADSNYRVSWILSQTCSLMTLFQTCSTVESIQHHIADTFKIIGR
ncbi:hypothetical protein S83_013234 [Arachis hypogaea]